MSKYVTTGSVTAVLSFAAIIAGAFGKKPLEMFLNDPATAQSVMTAVGAFGTLLAGALQGIKK